MRLARYHTKSGKRPLENSEKLISEVWSRMRSGNSWSGSLSTTFAILGFTWAPTKFEESIASQLPVPIPCIDAQPLISPSIETSIRARFQPDSHVSFKIWPQPWADGSHVCCSPVPYGIQGPSPKL